MAKRDDTSVTSIWDKNAAAWTAQVREGKDLYWELFNNPLFLEFVPDLAGRRVIDLGCGEGRNTRVFAKRGAQMTGIDLSPSLIEAARAAEIAEPLGIEYHVGSFSELAPFPNENFDAAISVMAFMDGPDFYDVAREVHRVLRRGGALYFSVTHPCFCPHGAHWVTNPDGQVVGRLVSGYWRQQPYILKWRFSGFPEGTEPFSVLYFPYRLEDYVNGLCEAGFRILRIREPRPTEEMVRAYPPLQREREHVPIFLYVAAGKT
ncbi:MAG: class I SAM-dependent methyltransferase [Deltaproteobacteria bacterium]|nr:class I SAM-dependent methyltransferase [Deltaproteobacteria bacterium]